MTDIDAKDENKPSRKRRRCTWGIVSMQKPRAFSFDSIEELVEVQRSFSTGNRVELLNHTVECVEIEQIVNSMPTENAPGIDKILLRVMKDCLPAILPTLTSIISNSLTSGVFRSVWKTAEVIPVHKQGDHEKPENNRHISLLPILSNICDRTALNQFMTYFVSNDRLSTEQSGNKKWHSTETSLIYTTDMILSAIDQKKATAMVLLDMSKAFDSISHKILPHKLQDMGASTSAIDWFRSYLSNRTQVVRINAKISGPLQLASGVPQGSILGPMLFGIYVNDLPSTPRNCLTESYVDETKLYMSFRPQDCGDTISAMNTISAMKVQRRLQNFRNFALNSWKKILISQRL
ncbi:putative RNA-directed DNA polymerase from transposon BS [Stylophora pistillata]|uniref:Putative RNA-directed DNA polymerase from transposon BS n=1 Tax=Stylophora pistillata TaxID=50429 RepID=A0A2B4RJU9_STYPI|nr:putative RNA-directed DNA polymerase from transposon BS [Stylophora pistillata]